jgi:hypothetical protein
LKKDFEKEKYIKNNPNNRIPIVIDNKIFITGLEKL